MEEMQIQQQFLENENSNMKSKLQTLQHDANYADEILYQIRRNADDETWDGIITAANSGIKNQEDNNSYAVTLNLKYRAGWMNEL